MEAANLLASTARIAKPHALAVAEPVVLRKRAAHAFDTLRSSTAIYAGDAVAVATAVIEERINGGWTRGLGVSLCRVLAGNHDSGAQALQAAWPDGPGTVSPGRGRSSRVGQARVAHGGEEGEAGRHRRARGIHAHDGACQNHGEQRWGAPRAVVIWRRQCCAMVPSFTPTPLLEYYVPLIIRGCL